MYLLGSGWKKKQQQFEESEGHDAGQVHTFIGIGSSEQEMQQLHLDGKVMIYELISLDFKDFVDHSKAFSAAGSRADPHRVAST